MAEKTKLEMTWLGKDNRPRLEPRIIIEDQTFSHHALSRRESDIFDNLLIHGDNLLALKALEGDFAGTIKCIYADPPYNTGSAFAHYEDGIEHSAWLSLIRERLVILWNLLSDDGSLWVSIDDYEMPYLRVLMDELFGRSKFIATNVWQKRYSRENRAAIGDVHEYIVVYAKNPEIFKEDRGLLPLTEEQAKVYKNPNNDPRGPWRTIPITAQAGHATKAQFYSITGPTGKIFDPPPGNCWRYSKDAFEKLRAGGRIYFGKDGSAQPTTIRYLSEVDGAVPWTWWPHNEVGNTDESKKEMIALFPGIELFDTPKPERLLHRIIHIATKPGDLVLDSFAGSGTTGAVAHKMGRRWIMVELGDHCETHIVPRLNKVIDGKDSGGVTDVMGWKGGGGYRYFKLAPSLLEKDQFGQWVISKAYNPEMLAEAMCKHFGYTYAPSTEHYWMHGYSSEADFIYVTTNSLTHDQLRSISDEVGSARTLLICCKAFQTANADNFSNLTIRKIPAAVLDRCEWGKDDYSLKIEALPLIADEDDHLDETAPAQKSSRQPGLFDGDAEAGN